MIKIVLNVQGMMCPHCEARVTKAVQDAIAAQSVTASHKKGTVEVICPDTAQPGTVKAAAEAAGYSVSGIEIKKKGLFGLWV